LAYQSQYSFHISRSSADWVQKVVPFRQGITDMPMSATKSFLPPVVWMTSKKYFLFMKKELWQKIIHFAITILTAIATTLGITSCIGLMQ